MKNNTVLISDIPAHVIAGPVTSAGQPGHFTGLREISD